MGRNIGDKDIISRKYKHCFSRQYLQDHGVSITRGNERILGPVPKLYKIVLPNTRYYVGQAFVQSIQTKPLTSYEQLQDLGLVIVSRRIQPHERWDMGQQVVYELKYKNRVSDHLGKFPGGKYGATAEYDPLNKAVRLIGVRTGPLGYGPWTPIERDTSNFSRGGGKQIQYTSYGERSDEIINNQVRDWLGMEHEETPVMIKEAAFMISKSNEIVCFPNIPDMPSILITGMKGSGKSFCLHSLVSRFFWKPEYKFKIVILNDSSRETGTWCYPNNDGDQIMMLKKLNERPLPLPTVYLHPKVKDEYEKLYMGSVGFDVSIPFKEIVENHKDYLQIEGSQRYFNKIKDKLKNAETENMAEGILDLMGVGMGIPQNSANKIRAEFEMLFDSKMTDISSKKQYPWSVSVSPNRRFNPLTACVHAGVLPVLESEYISNQRSMLSIYFTYFVKDLFMRQKQDPDFQKQRSEIMMVIDECHNISQKGMHSGADMLLRRCVREGRPRRIGTLLATQKFSELPDIIKDNSTYLICFKNPGEAAAIANQYKMGKQAVEFITDLEKHECLAYTTEYFIVYDTNGKRRKSKPNEIFVGRSLPPYSMHKRPKAEDAG